MNITTAQLQSKGYLIATAVNEPLLNRCCSDAIEAYIKPILPAYNEEDEDVVNAVYCLTYILSLQRSIVKTRFGAKEKTNKNSRSIDDNNIVDSLGGTAHMYLTVLTKKEGAALSPEINDIAKIYYLTNLV